jgi:hypothetical protein
LLHESTSLDDLQSRHQDASPDAVSLHRADEKEIGRMNDRVTAWMTAMIADPRHEAVT